MNKLDRLAFNTLNLEVSPYEHKPQLSAFQKGFEQAVKLLEQRLEEQQPLSHVLWELNNYIGENNG